MSLKQLQSRLVKLNIKIKNRQVELAGLREQARDLKSQVADAKAHGKTKPSKAKAK